MGSTQDGDRIRNARSRVASPRAVAEVLMRKPRDKCKTFPAARCAFALTVLEALFTSLAWAAISALRRSREAGAPKWSESYPTGLRPKRYGGLSH